MLSIISVPEQASNMTIIFLLLSIFNLLNDETFLIFHLVEHRLIFNVRKYRFLIIYNAVSIKINNIFIILFVSILQMNT